MTTLTYTRRLNTGQYEHAEASCTISPEDIGLTREAATQHIRSLVHMTLGMEAASSVGSAVLQAASTPEPVIVLPVSPPATVMDIVPAPIAPPPIVADASASIGQAAVEPELDDISFRRIAGHHVERINKLRPGRGGTEVNSLTAEFVEPPLGLSAIPMERRQEYKARLEAIR